jgi:hypothetical protein
VIPVPSDDDFYAKLPIFDGFANIMEPSLYRPVPDGWFVGLTDVVESTRAIEAGRYKAVNTAGASVIAAVTNALGNRLFPFVFGGDGASFAVAAGNFDLARAALAATSTWAGEELGLQLRAALVPVKLIREQGLDVRVARFAPSRNVSYAMFSGGGLGWAERQMKEGRFAVSPASAGARPDLNGLSCRWREMPATHGTILSLLVTPMAYGDPGFRGLVEELLAMIEASGEAARPVPDEAPGVAWPPAGFDIEARATRKSDQSLFARRLSLLAETLFGFVVMRFGLKVGDFDAKTYKREVVENSDFRKYDDALRMTLDCSAGLADRIEARLGKAEADGVATFGVHRQPAAIMTCIVPSIYESNHVHFVDGAAGGYALAAKRLKERVGNHKPRSS